MKTLCENSIPFNDGTVLINKITVDVAKGKGRSEITLSGYDGATVTYSFMFDVELPKGDEDG